MFFCKDSKHNSFLKVKMFEIYIPNCVMYKNLMYICNSKQRLLCFVPRNFSQCQKNEKLTIIQRQSEHDNYEIARRKRQDVRL